MTEGQCALYARVSSESQARDNTIASQVAALRERIAVETSNSNRITATWMKATVVRSCLVRP
jgi:hypothetical protein